MGGGDLVLGDEWHVRLDDRVEAVLRETKDLLRRPIIQI